MICVENFVQLIPQFKPCGETEIKLSYLLLHRCGSFQVAGGRQMEPRGSFVVSTVPVQNLTVRDQY
jgi:hypothetical protein